MTEREQQLSAAKAEAHGLAFRRVDGDVLERDLLSRLEDWRGLFSRHVPQARQILRKLLPSPLRFTPHGERLAGYFDFEGEAALGRLLAGSAACPTSVASPRGYEERRQWEPTTLVVGVAA